MTQEEMVEFFLSWNLDITDEWKNDLPYTLLPKCLKEAEEKFGEKFRKFLLSQTDTTDNHTYLCAESWDELFSRY
jgi:hypothetical protein